MTTHTRSQSATSIRRAARSGPAAEVGTTFTVPTYTGYGNTALFGPRLPAHESPYQNITQVTSNINSSYNALVAEIQNRSIHNLQFDFNYTWSHALDFNQNATTTDLAE